jgi:hypothetical protein
VAIPADDGSSPHRRKHLRSRDIPREKGAFGKFIFHLAVGPIPEDGQVHGLSLLEACIARNKFSGESILMPMISPQRLSSGPPEFPGLMGVSVWINGSMRENGVLGRIRLIAETMPRVSV